MKSFSSHAALAICMVAMASPAQAQADTFHISAGRLEAALKAYIKQSGRSVFYKVDELGNIKSRGVNGDMSADAAIKRILSGTGFKARIDVSGAIAIVADPAARQQVAPASPTAEPETTSSSSDQGSTYIGANEIFVTARKKGESDLSVPIAIKALGVDQLNRNAIQNLSDVAAITPSLNITQSPANSGGVITLRGIGSPSTAAGNDQAVAINLDGITIADGMAVNFAQFDLERVEVLQGPQSLYYGKNSSAGIINVVSADPTDTPYAMVRGAYNFNARGIVTEAVLSGPLADGLTARIAFYRNDQKGYFHNAYKGPDSVGEPTPDQLAIFGPLPPVVFSRGPNATDTGLRATLKFEPNDALTIRLKGGYFHRSGSESAYSAQYFYCPAGVPSPLNIGNVPGAGECKADTTTASIGKAVDSVIGEDPRFGNGDPVEKLTQYLGQADISYNFDDKATLDSVTGYYKHHYLSVGIPGITLYPTAAALDDVRLRQFSQEFRVRTTLDTPINGMFGVYYQKGKFDTEVPLTILNSTQILPSNDYYFESETLSAFGQLTYKGFDDKLEVSAGARYTDEKKSQEMFSRTLDAFVTDLPVTKLRSKRLLPEVSVSFRPSREINIFATWKKGAKSGGFNSNILAPQPYSELYNGYNDEKVSGFEGGVKSVLFGGDLRFDVTAYRYVYKDLQVSVYDTEANNSATRNAATAKTQGVQISSNFAPSSIPGFNLSASLDYNKARYGTYLAQCYTGQTISEGCNLDGFGNVVETGAINQSLDGRPTTLAPSWSGSVNAAYDFPLASETRLGMSAGATYTDRYNPLSNLVPQAWQGSGVNINAQLRLFDEDDGWELALIGKNLTNLIRVQWGLETPFTPGLGVDPGTGTAGPGLQSDLFGFVNPPRQIMLRLTLKPFDFLNRN